jgi:ketosteroid isomerase-like protein
MRRAIQRKAPCLYSPTMGSSARDPAYDASADKVVDNSTVWILRTKGGKVVQTLIAVVSADGKTNTITITMFPSMRSSRSEGSIIMNRRIGLILFVATLLGLAITFPQSVSAQSNPWIGTWNTNLAKSTYSPGPPPRSNILTFQPEGQGHRVTVETINAQGSPAKFVLVRPHEDGKPYPVTGVAGFDAEAIKAVNDSTYWIIRTKDGKIVSTIVSVMSADRKSFTDTFAGVNPNGQPFYNVLVREKQ